MKIPLPSADVLSGYNATIFAYGQTSSGKTHTMEVSMCGRNDLLTLVSIFLNIH